MFYFTADTEDIMCYRVSCSTFFKCNHVLALWQHTVFLIQDSPADTASLHKSLPSTTGTNYQKGTLRKDDQVVWNFISVSLSQDSALCLYKSNAEHLNMPDPQLV